MSALPPKADICSALAHVCFRPRADSCGAGNNCLFDVAICTTWTALRRWPAHSTIAVALRLMTALVRYWIRLVAELTHRVRGFDAGRQERWQEHERAFGRLAVRHHRSDGQRPMPTHDVRNGLRSGWQHLPRT